MRLLFITMITTIAVAIAPTMAQIASTLARSMFLNLAVAR